MRILNVGDFNWMTGRERDTANLDLFAIRQKLSRAAVRAGHLVVEFSDRAVARTAAPLGLKSLGLAACRRMFLNVVDEARPDLILLNFADKVDNAALAEARALSPGVRIVDINIDPLPDPKTRARLDMRRASVDAVFVTTAGPSLRAFTPERGFAAFLPNPVDAAVETGRAFETPGPTDLIFPAGDDSPRDVGAERLRPSQALARLAGLAPTLKLQAPGLTSPRLRGRAYFDALEQARLGWALSRHAGEPLYASDRMAHMLGSGLATFIDRRSGFDRIYAPDEVVFYDGLKDLAAKAVGLRQDDARRRETARRGWEKTWAVFEVGQVFAYLLEQVFDGEARDRVWPCERWTP